MNFRKLLPEDPSVRAVLNGGHTDLDDATVPFTLVFDKSVAQMKPTHVLVITLPYSSYETVPDNTEETEIPLNYYVANGGERQIFELSKVDFLQFHRPGKQNVIFILISNLDKESSKEILKKRDLGQYYENSIRLSSIPCNFISGINIAGYYEEIVDVPKEFFSIIPETGFAKVWWNWVNRWHKSNPVDQCQYRERLAISVTIKPAAWLIGFILRLFIITIADIACAIVVIITYLSGIQVTLRSIKEFIIEYNWNFLFKYPYTNYSQIFSWNYWPDNGGNETKEYYFGGQKIKIPISPLGLILQIGLWAAFINCVYSFFFDPSWEAAIGYFIGSVAMLSFALVHLFGFVIQSMPYEKIKPWIQAKYKKPKYVQGPSPIFNDTIVVWIGVLMFIFIFGFIFRVPWVKVANVSIDTTSKHSYGVSVTIAIILLFIYRKRLWLLAKMGLKKVVSWIDSKFDTVITKTTATKSIDQKPLTLVEWYGENMNIQNIPAKVDFEKVMVAPTKKKEVALKFKVSFWRLKTKVCKPFAKV